MPKRLQGLFTPTFMLWLYAMALTISAGISDGELSGRAEFVSRLTLPFLIAWWVVDDAQKRQRSLCYDYDSFVFLAWLVVVPVYLFQTRGARAFLTLLCFAGIWLAALLTAGVIFAIREFLRP